MSTLTYTIAVLSGDGIGPEVMREALKVGALLKERLAYSFIFKEGLVGGAAFDAHGSHLPQETLSLCANSDAILFGSVGGPLSERHLPKWNGCETQSILALRKNFKFGANLRPTRVLPSLSSISPLKNSLIERGIDFVIVRELLGDCYFGEHTLALDDAGKRIAFDGINYDESQIRTVAHHAFTMARARRRHLTLAHKANVLATSRLWQEVVDEVALHYPEVTYQQELVDSCALHLVTSPHRYDVLLTSNMFGDILSDLASALPGSLGLSASASLTSATFGLYEPSGGSAPDIAGKGIANPCAQILSLALLFRYSLGDDATAQLIERSVEEVLTEGIRTCDLLSDGDSSSSASTEQIGTAIAQRIAEKF
jgi:3-isopropylmalate dehydrogenase